MHLDSLHLRNFRNFEEARFEFGPEFNLLIGRNAQGKTNAIEAIGLLATGRSFRTQEFRDMIRHDAEAADVSARGEGECGADDLRVSIDLARKNFFRNAKRTTPGGFSGVRTVLFAPEEILLLKDSPSARRRYIDTLISQLVASYKGLTRRYERVVGHRNRLLQDESLTRTKKTSELKPWDEHLVDLGAEIIVSRAEWLGRLGDHIPGKHAAFAAGDGRAAFIYRPHFGEDIIPRGDEALKKGLANELHRRREDEFQRGMTLVGPHRDDMEALVGGSPLKHFGSQGQHRSFVLALKQAEMDLMREVTGEAPILLLDDVASELDCGRNRSFFESLAGAEAQVFITATAEDDVRLDAGAGLRVFDIESGKAAARK